MRPWLYCFKPMARRLLASMVLWAACCGLGAAETILIIAHPALPVATLDAEALSRIYLLRQTLWPDGTMVVPINREASSPVRSAFSSLVLKESATALAAYWQEMHFKGKNPPLIQESDQAVQAFVQKVPGAIGYVSADTPLNEGVKLLGKLP